MRTFLIIITTVFVTTVIAGLAQRFYDRANLDRQYAAGYDDGAWAQAMLTTKTCNRGKRL